MLVFESRETKKQEGKKCRRRRRRRRKSRFLSSVTSGADGAAASPVRSAASRPDFFFLVFCFLRLHPAPSLKSQGAAGHVCRFGPIIGILIRAGLSRAGLEPPHLPLLFFFLLLPCAPPLLQARSAQKSPGSTRVHTGQPCSTSRPILCTLQRLHMNNIPGRCSTAG